MLGQALGGRRKDIVLATKAFVGLEPGTNKSGLSRRHILVEDTVYGDDALVDVSTFERRIFEYVAAHGARVVEQP